MANAKIKAGAVLAALALMGTMGLAACTSSNNNASNAASNSAASTSSNAANSNAGPNANGNSAGLANPWHDVAGAEEAAKGAGLDKFTVPAPATPSSQGAPIDITEFRYMEGLAQGDGYVGAGIITVRKGTEGPDVSGDYNEYKFNWVETVDDKTVECEGDTEGRAQKATWTDGKYFYSLCAQAQGDGSEIWGLDPADLAILVRSIG